MAKLMAVTNATLSVQVENLLRAFILSGAARPGQRLTEAALAAELKVSRGPLREAVQRLVDEGLIVKEAYKSIYVRNVSVEELKELRSMRRVLESLAFQEAWPRRNAEALADLDLRYRELCDACREEDRIAIIDREVAFHSWAYENSGNGLLLSTWRGMAPLFCLYLSIFESKVGADSTFLGKAAEYHRLAKGEDLDAMLDHLVDHMNLGIARVIPRMTGQVGEA